MLPYQEKYIDNLKQILKFAETIRTPGEDFEVWYEDCLSSKEKIVALRKENNQILQEDLFPVLDDLYNASEEVLQSLEDFGDKLMDWKNNLDVGVYVIIHESLLKMYRIARNPSRIIKELYKLGMGYYYQDLAYRGSEHPLAHQFNFENEMLFTEASSYFRYFAQLNDAETRGYIIRALANIAISSNDRKKRLSSSIKTLNIVSDPYYRKLEPSLPWDTFERRTYQQISATRSTLSRGDFSNEELSFIMEACQVVFEPEKDNPNPNIRWLWPYYEMEYNLGLSSVEETLSRMEKLILSMNYDRYDESGLYANVQLPIYYGRLLKANPQLLEKQRYTGFLKEAYGKMMKTLMSLPSENMDEYFSYIFSLLANSYFETKGVECYADIMKKIIGRFTGDYYIRSRQVSDILALYCEKVLESDPRFFDKMPILKDLEDDKTKKEVLLSYARDAGLFYNFGLIPMNLEKIMMSRHLFQREDEIYTLHTDIGYHCLQERESTARFADVALGHHKHYEGEGYPSEYKRLDSPYRSFTDLAAIVSYLQVHEDEDIDELCASIQKQSRTIFSPILTSYLDDKDLRKQIKTILTIEKRKYYKELYDQLQAQ